jgi:GNAT superfamily N-acetyltransferase
MFTGGEMLGFLCCYEPWDHAYGSAAKGTFSPIQAHGAVSEHRGLIYKRLYQAAAETWVHHKITHHAVALYAHDSQALNAFYTYGFGLRCMDAVRPLAAFAHESCTGIVFREIAKTESPVLREMRKLHAAHLGESPCFMRSSPEDVESWLHRAEKRSSREFVATQKEKPIAFLEIQDDGENFATEVSGMMNLCGAFCMREYRGKGIMQGLLNHAMSVLQAEGYDRIGVDFESFNPTAHGFWTKFFTAYTHGVVRRIEECALME